MGWANDQIALLIVTAGSTFSGIFVYSPSPGTGNLVDSITAATLTDPYGNLAIGGIVNYQPGASPIAIQTSGAFIRFSQAASETGPYTPFATLGPLGADFQITVTGKLQLFAGITSFIVANSQLNMGPGGGAGTGFPINILDQAQPSTPGLGVKLWSSAAGHLETVSHDGNAYDTERQTHYATGQTVNSASFVAITGIGGLTLTIGTYRIHGRIICVPLQAGGAIELRFAASGGLVATVAAEFIEITYPVGGGAFTNGNANEVASGVTFTSTTVGAGLGIRYIDFECKAPVTTGGTLTLQVATTVAADTFTIDVASYLELLPVVA